MSDKNVSQPGFFFIRGTAVNWPMIIWFLISFTTVNGHRGSVEAEQSQWIIIIYRIDRVTLCLNDFWRNTYFLLGKSGLDPRKAQSSKGETTQAYFNLQLLLKHVTVLLCAKILLTFLETDLADSFILSRSCQEWCKSTHLWKSYFTWQT